MGNADNAVIDLVVDKSTGEIKDSIMVGDKVSIIRGPKSEFLANTMAIPFQSFVKLNGEEISLLARELNKGDLALLIALSRYVGYYDNCLKDRRGNPLTMAEIACKVGMPRSTVYKAINRLIAENIVCKARTSEFQLFVCPLLFCKGNRSNKVLQTMFRNYRVRSRGNIKWHKLLEREA